MIKWSPCKLKVTGRQKAGNWCEISGFHRGDCKDYYPLLSDTDYFGICPNRLHDVTTEIVKKLAN
jgi:hypothetical protein